MFFPGRREGSHDYCSKWLHGNHIWQQCSVAIKSRHAEQRGQFLLASEENNKTFQHHEKGFFFSNVYCACRETWSFSTFATYCIDSSVKYFKITLYLPLNAMLVLSKLFERTRRRQREREWVYNFANNEHKKLHLFRSKKGSDFTQNMVALETFFFSRKPNFFISQL
jgi:hypothetical protein